MFLIIKVNSNIFVSTKASYDGRIFQEKAYTFFKDRGSSIITYIKDLDEGF